MARQLHIIPCNACGDSFYGYRDEHDYDAFCTPCLQAIAKAEMEAPATAKHVPTVGHKVLHSDHWGDENGQHAHLL